MTKVNTHYENLQAGYLFPEISRRINAYLHQNPNTPLIRMGIGDVVLPIPSLHPKSDAPGH